MSVEETAEKISSMEVRGALDIALASARSLLREYQQGKSLSDLKKDGDKLKSARPTAVSLPNAVEYVLHLVEEHGEDAGEKIKKFISDQENSVERIAEYGSHLIQDGDVILTHCNSDTVVKVFDRALDDGKDFQVYACETRPRNQGYITVKALRDAKVPITLIVDSAAHLVMKKKDVDHVFVGADTVYVNGDVVNKIGTSQIALIAHANEIDFNVATGVIKFSPESMYGVESIIEERDPLEVADIEGVPVYNPAFDVTPKEHVTRVITEEGVIPPEAAYSLLKEKFAWKMRENG